MGNGGGSGVEENESNKRRISQSRRFSAIPACSQREVKRLLALLCMKEQRRGPSSPKLHVLNPIPAPSSGNSSLG